MHHPQAFKNIKLPIKRYPQQANREGRINDEFIAGSNSILRNKGICSACKTLHICCF